MSGRLRTPVGLLSSIDRTQALPQQYENQFQRDLMFAPGWRDWRRSFIRDLGQTPDVSPGGDYNYRLAWATGSDPQYHAPSDSYHGLSTAEMPPPFRQADLKAQDHPTMWKEDFYQRFGFDPDEIDVASWPDEAVSFVAGMLK